MSIRARRFVDLSLSLSLWADVPGIFGVFLFAAHDGPSVLLEKGGDCF